MHTHDAADCERARGRPCLPPPGPAAPPALPPRPPPPQPASSAGAAAAAGAVRRAGSSPAARVPARPQPKTKASEEICFAPNPQPSFAARARAPAERAAGVLAWALLGRPHAPAATCSTLRKFGNSPPIFLNARWTNYYPPRILAALNAACGPAAGGAITTGMTSGSSGWAASRRLHRSCRWGGGRSGANLRVST